MGLVFLVAVLTVSAAGVPSLLVAEPCGLTEPLGADEGTCLPTCVACGCCTEPAVPKTVVLTGTIDVSVPPAVSPPALSPEFDPRKILHVPKTRLS